MASAHTHTPKHMRAHNFPLSEVQCILVNCHVVSELTKKRAPKVGLVPHFRPIVSSLTCGWDRPLPLLGRGGHRKKLKREYMFS